MNHFHVVMKPAGGACNMACHYCFYKDEIRYRQNQETMLMTPEVRRAIIDQAFALVPAQGQITFSFQGGEPTLAGLDFFKAFCQEVAERRPVQSPEISYAIQTNGLRIDEDWIQFFKDQDVLLGLSIDGFEANHDRFRPDLQGQGTYAHIAKVLDLCQAYDLDTNILTVLTGELAQAPEAFYAFLQDKDIRFVQLIPCLNHMEPGTNPHALTPASYVVFLHTLFQLWLAELKQGTYRSIRAFDDIYNRMVFGVATACGIDGLCRAQVIVEANGDVYPCDFYCLDSYQAGNILADAWPAIQENLDRFPQRNQRSEALCQSCTYAAICGGGCRRMRAHTMFAPGETRCLYQNFLDSFRLQLPEIARSIDALKAQT